MMYEFIFEDTTPPTHCKDPVIAGANGRRCNATICMAHGASHHVCADRQEKVGTSMHMYCECKQNMDNDETGKRIKYYFRENKLGNELKCPSCRDNCGY